MTKAKCNKSKLQVDKVNEQQKIEQATVYTHCFASAAMAMGHLHGNLDIGTMLKIFTESAGKVNDGNMDEIEQMLITQAKALEFFFYQIMAKLADVKGLKAIQAYADIALKAQGQSRKALSALAEIKHPRRTTFIKQQNNAINQQVNNSEKIENFQNEKKVANELIDGVASYGAQNLDVRTTVAAISNDSISETVGAFNGAENPRRQVC